MQGRGIAGEHGTDTRLVECPHTRVPDVRAVNQAPIPVENRPIAVERTSPLVQPCAGDGRDAGCRMHVDGAVALTGKTVAQSEERAGMLAHPSREGLDVRDRHSAERARPVRGARRKMRFQCRRMIGIALKVLAVGKAIAKKAMHHRAGQRTVRAGPHAQEQIGLLGSGGAVGVHHHDAGAPCPAGIEGMAHHIDLGAGGVGPPDHDDVGVRHLARVDTSQASGAGKETGPGKRHADGGVLSGITLGMAQTVDAVAHHQSHRAGVEIRPDGLGAEPLLSAEEGFRHFVQRVVPGNRGEAPAAARSDTPQRLQQPVRVMNALGVTRHLAANHAIGVAVVARAPYLAHPAGWVYFDFQRAGGRAIVRASAVAELGRGVHRLSRGLSWKASVPPLRALGQRARIAYDAAFANGGPRVNIRILCLALCLPLIGGCLDFQHVRVTPEHRQLHNKVGIVVLVDPLPRLHHMQLSVLKSTAGALELPGWNAREAITSYLSERMRGMALDVRPVTYDDKTFPQAYDSSMAYAAFERLRTPLADWARAQGLDMVVVVYRQVEEDMIGDSIENMIGYGLARHAEERTDAYAAVYIEALDSDGHLIGNADGQKVLPVDDALWLPGFDADKQTVPVSGATGKALRTQIKQALLDAVLLAAQEAGLSH